MSSRIRNIDLIKEYMKTHEYPNFYHFAKITGLSPGYIKEFYTIYIDPSFSKIPFSEDENKLLKSLVANYKESSTGRMDWKKLEAHFMNPKRSSAQLKRQYNSLISKEKTVTKYSCIKDQVNIDF